MATRLTRANVVVSVYLRTSLPPADTVELKWSCSSWEKSAGSARPLSRSAQPRPSRMRASHAWACAYSASETPRRSVGRRPSALG